MDEVRGGRGEEGGKRRGRRGGRGEEGMKRRKGRGGRE